MYGGYLSLSTSKTINFPEAWYELHSTGGHPSHCFSQTCEVRVILAPLNVGPCTTCGNTSPKRMQLALRYSSSVECENKTRAARNLDLPFGLKALTNELFALDSEIGIINRQVYPTSNLGGGS